ARASGSRCPEPARAPGRGPRSAPSARSSPPSRLDITPVGYPAAMSVRALGVVHVNVNCSDLARSLRFYCDLVGLTPLVHTNPLPQDGAGFGLPGRVQWDAHLLHDVRRPLGPGVDLLEWKQPPPAGAPGRVQCAAHLPHDVGGRLGPAVDLLEWNQPPPADKPAEEANQLGMFR